MAGIKPIFREYFEVVLEKSLLAKLKCQPSNLVFVLS